MLSLFIPANIFFELALISFLLSFFAFYESFMSYLSLFTFFMLILVTGDNFVPMFVGWEGVGLRSYLLINFEFTKIPANKAAIKTMILNRIGDFSLVLGILTIFVTYIVVDYATALGFNSYLICDGPEDWQTSTTKTIHNFLSFDLVIPLILVFYLTYLGVLFGNHYAKKKRRKLSTVLFDAYVNLFFSLVSKRTAPRWFTMTTLGLGSFIVKGLFLYKYINAKLGIMLAFTLPMTTFRTFLVLTVVLPFHLAASFPDGFGRRFFGFLENKCSKNVFIFIRRKSITKTLKIKKIQIRNYSATSKVNTVLSELVAITITKINLLVDPTQARHVRAIKEVMRSSFIEGN
jgi:NADH:ubiquinone oxidoreductase subunit 5 (subunit L)/multisubunit Na+/H+ antiporter MnhA subunit